MVARVTHLYVEGGARENKHLNTRLRGAFGELLKHVVPRSQPRVVACGGRAAAYRDFCNALERPGEAPLLLVDAEGPVDPERSAWDYVAQREGDRWTRPRHATDAHLHLMTQLMETWLLIEPPDHPLLLEYFGGQLMAQLLPRRSQLEQITKDDVLRTLKQATRNTSKGSYNKGSHSFDLLAKLATPQRLRRLEERSPRAAMLFSTLRQGLP